MQIERLAVEGSDFATFSEENCDAILLSSSMVIEHKTLGQGIVESITPRQRISPILNIRFPHTGRLSKFNLDAFKSEMISIVGLPVGLASAFLAWQSKIERLESERAAAEKAVQEELVLRHEAERVAAATEAELAVERRREMETRVEPFASHMVDVSPYASARESMEKYEVARLEHFRRTLPPRIEWLKDWARRITQGETGLEPIWSQGRASASYLQAMGVVHLWHFTDIRNLNQILEAGGLISYMGLEVLVVQDAEVWLSANDESIRRDKDLGRQDSVRLSFVPNSFFFQRANRGQHSVWLRFSPLALALGEVSYSRGNAASEFSSLYNRPEALALDWALLRSFSGCHEQDGPPLSYPTRYASERDDPECVRQEKIMLNSEILVKHFLPLDFCNGIFDVQRRTWLSFSRTE